VEDKVFKIYELSNGVTLLSLVETDEPSEQQIWLDKPSRLMMMPDGSGFGFMPWTPYAKDGELIPVNRTHIISEFTAAYPLAEAYYQQVHSKIDLPPPQRLVLP